MKRKTGRGPKDKGKAFEREIVASILAAFPQLSPNDVLARSMGDPGVDIILSEAARKVLPLAIECKRVGRVEDLNIRGALDQAQANCDEGLLAVVVYRADRHKAQATWRGEFQFKDKSVLPNMPLTCSWTDLLRNFGGFKE